MKTLISILIRTSFILGLIFDPTYARADSVPMPAVQDYARQLVTQIAGRPLTAEERTLIRSKGADALPQLLTKWLADPFFAKAFRARVEMLVGSSGKRDDVDFNLPGNLAEYVVDNKLPFGDIITADYCVDAGGMRIACDTGAPFAAGVVATRGYLKGHASRFNLSRANALMNAFACTHYPMSDSLQPRAEKESLVPNFRIATEEEAKAAGATGFGNGAACYMCHGQFSQHAQLFIKFDADGIYRADAKGNQSKDLEFGKSDNGLYASHFNDESRAKDEAGNMFGTPSANLAEGMKVLAGSPQFIQCMAKQVVTHVFNLDSEQSNAINKLFLTDVATGLAGDQATVAAVYKKVLTHPEVIKAFARGVAP